MSRLNEYKVVIRPPPKGLRCISCNKEFGLLPVYECDRCGGILEVVADEQKLKDTIEAYTTKKAKPKSLISLGEGNTPLVKAKKLADRLGIENLLLKNEFSNPTGSFKDRPVSVGVNKALEFGYKRVIVASSGNGAASTAAYAARAGMEAIVLVPESTPMEKVKQTLFYGAKVFRVRGPYSDCFNLAKEVAERFDMFNLTTTYINPYTVEGDKTVAYELFEQMDGYVPDVIYVPIGAGPLLAGVYKGYGHLYEFGKIDKMPKMAGIQAEGCSPIAKAFLSGQTEVKAEKAPSTIAGGICDGLDGYSKDGTYTLNIIKQSDGFSIYSSDSEIALAQKWLAEDEGLFVEPSSAAAVAGILKSLSENRISRSSTVVALLTGHGLKDIGKIQIDGNVYTISNDVSELIGLLG
jgi:threonine synthase